MESRGSGAALGLSPEADCWLSSLQAERAHDSVEYVIESEWFRAIRVPYFGRLPGSPCLKSELLHHTQLVHLCVVGEMRLICIGLESRTWEIVTLVTEIDTLLCHAEEHSACFLRV